MSLEVLRLGPQRLRIGPWRGLPDVAYIAPQTPGAVSLDAYPALFDLVFGDLYRAASEEG